MSFKHILILFFCFTSSRSFGQTLHQIKLLDADDTQAIIGAKFSYGDQQGLSDENGVITFQSSGEDTMTISHLSYGTWKWDHQKLKQVVERQVFYCQSVSVHLYPVTIIAVKYQDHRPDQLVAIDHQDRMEHDAAAILNQTPAFTSIRKSGAYGFEPVFRGYKYDQLNIVLNGAQGATAACPNRMDPPTSQMAPNMMDRIEILKGPHALRYGTGVGATINFIPSKLRYTHEPNLYGRISGGYEGNGNVYRTEGQIGVSNNSYDLSFFGSWSTGSDYKTGDDKPVEADFTRGSFGTNLGLKLSNRQQLRVSAIYNMARDVDFPALPMDLRKDDTWLVNAHHDIQINRGSLESWNTTVFGSFVDHLMDNLLKPLDPRMMNASTAAQTYHHGGRTEGTWQFASSKFYGGMDLRIEGAKGIRERTFLMGPKAGNTVEDNAWQNGRITKTGLFGEYHLTANRLHYLFSGRLELNNANVSDPGEKFLQVNPKTEINQLNPSFSIGAQKTMAKHWTTGIWLGRAQRSGSLTERYINYFPVGQDPYEMLGNPLLSPEVNNQMDVTLEWKTQRSAINIDVFGSYLQNYISSVIDTSLSPVLPTSPGVRQYVNIDKALKTGFELSWTQRLPLNLHQQIAVAYTYAQDLELDEPLPEISPMDVRYVLSGNHLKGKLIPEIAFRYVMEQSRISEEFGETATPSFALLDVKVRYNITNDFRVNAGINNLLDKNYYEHLNRSLRGTQDPIYAPGRNAFINMSFNF